MSLEDEVTQLCAEYDGLESSYSGNKTFIKGILAFNASFQKLESIADWFEIEITITEDYPRVLPVVKEIQGKVHSDYNHLYSDATFCLATPLAVRQSFSKNPTLLGFINNLVIPYLYSYCYWERNGSMPFDERSHGLTGLVEHYCDLFETDMKPKLWQGLQRISKYGYRGHHLCPCGSGKILRNCHSKIAMEIAQFDNRVELNKELLEIKILLDSKN